jgi:hypothetical protein
VRAYRRELPEKMKALEAAAVPLTMGGSDEAALKSVYDQAHRIAGSAAIYGLPDLSTAARDVADLPGLALAAPGSVDIRRRLMSCLSLLAAIERPAPRSRGRARRLDDRTR